MGRRWAQARIERVFMKFWRVDRRASSFASGRVRAKALRVAHSDIIVVERTVTRTSVSSLLASALARLTNPAAPRDRPSGQTLFAAAQWPATCHACHAYTRDMLHVTRETCYAALRDMCPTVRNTPSCVPHCEHLEDSRAGVLVPGLQRTWLACASRCGTWSLRLGVGMPEESESASESVRH